MKKIVTILLFMFGAFAATAQKPGPVMKLVPGPAPVPKGKLVYKAYTDQKNHVSIKYPATWIQKPNAETIFQFMRQYEERGQKFKESVNLMIGPAEDLYLVEYVMDAQRKMPETMPYFKMVTGDYIKIGGLDCYRMVYRFESQGFQLQNVMYLIIKDAKAYNLTFGATPETFDRFFPIFETIAKSFRIK